MRPSAQRAQARVAELLTPIVQGAGRTDIGVEVASLGVQVHGGMGFIEETGAAQHYRDARITPIYEGTNGIQAIDLVGRKLVRDQGAAAYALIAEMRDLPAMGRRHCRAASMRSRRPPLICWKPGERSASAMAGATPYLYLVRDRGRWLADGKAALAAPEKLRRNEGDPRFLKGKLLSAQFYARSRTAPGSADCWLRSSTLASITTSDPDLL